MSESVKTLFQEIETEKIELDPLENYMNRLCVYITSPAGVVTIKNKITSEIGVEKQSIQTINNDDIFILFSGIIEKSKTNLSFEQAMNTFVSKLSIDQMGSINCVNIKGLQDKEKYFLNLIKFSLISAIIKAREIIKLENTQKEPLIHPFKPNRNLR